MSSVARTALRCTRPSFIRPAYNTVAARRWQSTEAPANPKIAAIVDQISTLTLLETADLVSALKVRGPFVWGWDGGIWDIG